jgi:hypothetical protein
MKRVTTGEVFAKVRPQHDGTQKAATIANLN